MKAMNSICNVLLCVGVALGSGVLAGEKPVIQSVTRDGEQIVVRVGLPSGFRHVVLEASGNVIEPASISLVAGALDGSEAVAIFQVPVETDARFLSLRVGEQEDVPGSVYSGPGYLAVTSLSDVGLSDAEAVGHVLNRVGYGPGAGDRLWAETLGAGGYVLAQLDPGGIDESDNAAWLDREAALFDVYEPHLDVPLVAKGDIWKYAKGDVAPPVGWAGVGFDDAGWLEGPSGFGYGDNDDATVLEDMRQTDTQPGYYSVFIRKRFSVPSGVGIEQLVLRVVYDDGFVAYLNGVEVARENLEGVPPLYSAGAVEAIEPTGPNEYVLDPGLLVAGENVIAVQAHNANLSSSDLSMIPELVMRSVLPEPAERRIRGIEELQQLLHVRGVYSRRQLKAVLGEFWENHFTTDYDKLADFFDDLRNSDARDAMTMDQAAREAAQAEYSEYQFFYENALGNFGDLLLYSATSPAMLVYLDGVLNMNGEPNENYAREILELFAFGVDNRYTQRDIEELARCFTGWTVRKVWPSAELAFPVSAREPLTEESVRFEDVDVVGVGAAWKYFKGLSEPAGAGDGSPTTAWAEVGYDDSGWLDGSTGIGYGDGDDATVLGDMRNTYGSVYLRREFTLNGPGDLENLLLGVKYDDGFVAYVNGVEVGRSRTMNGAGEPPAFDALALGGHEASLQEEVFGLEAVRDVIRFAPEVNVLAIQVHNITLNSSDLSMIPRLIQRNPLPGSIENGDPNGHWVFRFNPEEHDTGAKVLFEGTEYQMNIPAGRVGVDGVNDAIEVIDAMVSHPSTREFICMKLIHRFVSDDIDLISYRNGTAPAGLRQLMDDALAAWMSTSPAGNIEAVLRAILRPGTRDGYFWSQSAYRAKVKTPVEFVNSTLRAVGAEVSGVTLPEVNDRLGMHLFTRDDPDGWSELGFDWMDTGTLLARVQWAQLLGGNLDNSVVWDTEAWLASLTDSSLDGMLDYFDWLLFDGHMTEAQRAVLVRFASTNDLGVEVPLDPGQRDYLSRVRDLVALVLAMPQVHQQ
ncbi:MAG: hypothetical protein RI897_4003 [Verrucomicrobiota bacterium]